MSNLAPTYVNDEGIRREQAKPIERIRLERNWAIVVGLLGWLFAVAALLVLWRLIPLKTAESVLVTLDTSTGHVVDQRVITPEVIGAQEALSASALHDYVIHCFEVDPDKRQANADWCHLHSTPEVAKHYDWLTSPDNPNNPYALVGKNGKTEVKVISVSVTDKHHGTVWYSATTSQDGAKPTKPAYFVYTAAFVYTGKPVRVKNRWENPLGWAVTSGNNNEDASHQ